MPIHIIADDVISYYGQRDELFFILSSLFDDMKYGWHTLQRSQLIFTSEKLKEVIDKLLASNNLITKRAMDVLYGDKLIELNRTSEAHQKAFFLIQIFNQIVGAIKNETNGYILLIPDYSKFYNRIFHFLKSSLGTTSIDMLISKFGPQVTDVVNDLIAIGIIKQKDNLVWLSELAKELPFLIGKGSANDGPE